MHMGTHGDCLGKTLTATTKDPCDLKLWNIFDADITLMANNVKALIKLTARRTLVHFILSLMDII